MEHIDNYPGWIIGGLFSLKTQDNCDSDTTADHTYFPNIGLDCLLRSGSFDYLRQQIPNLNHSSGNDRLDIFHGNQ